MRVFEPRRPLYRASLFADLAIERERPRPLDIGDGLCGGGRPTTQASPTFVVFQVRSLPLDVLKHLPDQPVTALHGPGGAKG